MISDYDYRFCPSGAVLLAYPWGDSDGRPHVERFEDLDGVFDFLSQCEALESQPETQEDDQ